MSGRFNDTLTFAYDTKGNWHLVTHEYAYAGGCGNYHSRVEIKDKFYDVDGCVDLDSDAGAFKTVEGTYLRYTDVEDCASYFSATQTNTIQTVLQEAGLTDMDFSCFLMIDIYSTNTGMYLAVCSLISKEGVSITEHNLVEEEFYGDMGDVTERLLSIYEPPKTRTGNNPSRLSGWIAKKEA